MAEYKTEKQVNYGFGLSFEATGKAPVVAKRIWATLADAQAYVDSVTDTAIAGLQLTVIKDTDLSKNGVYFVQAAAGEDGKTKGVLVKLASGGDASGALADAKKYTDNVKTELLGKTGVPGNTIISAKEDAADAKAAADNASNKVDTEIGKLNSTVHNGKTATSAGDAASAQIKVTVEESKGKLTGVTVNAPSFESAGAADNVKTELLGETGVSGNTIISAKEDAAAAKTAADNASKKVDDEIKKLDGGGTSTVVKGVTVTVNETDGKVTQPVISIADGTLTGAATDGNLVTGTVVKKYVDDKVSKINTAAGELGTRVTALEGTVGDKTKGLVKDMADAKSAIDKINGTGDGSFAKGDADTLADAKKYTDDFKGRTEGFATAAQGTKADDALQSIEKSGDYINVTKKADNKQTVSLTTQTIKDASDTVKGLAEASDVKVYVDNTKTALIGTDKDAATADTIKGAKAAAADAKTAANAKISAVTSKTGDKYVKATTDGTAVTIESIGIDRAIGDAKNALIGTLIGTDKDAATADTIKGAKAAAADAKAAAKAADDKAAAAQTAADSKIKSVTGDHTVIATTTDHAVAVSLKTNNNGNVKFTQDAGGLSANVTIPPATVTGVVGDDKFLSLTDKLVGADVSIAYDPTDKKIYLYGKDKTKANAVSSIDCKDFIKDGMLEKAALEVDPAGQPAGTYIVLTWNTDGGKNPMYINVTSLIDIYTAKPNDGLTLTDHEFSVDWSRVAKKSDLDTVTGKVSTLEGKVGSAAVGETAATGLFKEVADAKAAAANASNKVDIEIGKLDVANNTSDAVAGIAVTVNETDGKVIKPIVKVTPGSVAAGNASVVTGGTVKTYVDTAITNAALTWTEI